MTDRELLDGYVREKSGEAMREIVGRYSGMVHAAALREVRDAHLAEDVTQAVFLVLMRRAGSLSPRVVLGGWLFKTTLYAAADARRRVEAQRRHEREVSRMATEAAVQSAPRDDVMAALNEELGGLSPGDRAAVVMRYFQGLTGAELAQALGTNEVAARRRVSRAVERLRKRLARMGVGVAVAALAGTMEATARAAPATLVGQLEALAMGQAPATGLSEVIAQGVTRMIRKAQMKAIAAVAAGLVVLTAVGVTLSQGVGDKGNKTTSQETAGGAPATTAATAPIAPAMAAPVAAAEPIDESAAMKATVDADTAFAADLYQAMLKDNADKNLFVSPYSVSTILGLTAAGARGGTAEQMNKVLHIGSAATNSAGIARLSRQLGDTQGGQRPYQLYTANAIWGSAAYPVVPEFNAMAQKFYGTDGVRLLDFRGDPEGSRGTINRWVEDQTKTKIKDLLPARSINSMTAIVLTNTIYFKGTWQRQFDPRFTTAQSFHVTAEKEMKIALMRNGGPTEYFEDEDVQVVSLPYRAVMGLGAEREATSMLLVLPKKAEGLSQVETKLTAEKLNGWIAGLAMRPGSVLLPRFTITQPVKLNNILQGMGMMDAFEASKADFGGMIALPHGGGVFIGGVYHKAFVDLNEEGTEAAAATAVAGAGGGRPQNPFVFRADHPFFFAIRYEPTNSILFMGHLMEPTAADANLAATRTLGPGTFRPGPTLPVARARSAATAALALVKATREDTAFVSETVHVDLWKSLDAIEAAAKAIQEDQGSDADLTNKANALAAAVQQALRVASAYSVAGVGTAEDEAKARRLGTRLRAVVNPPVRRGPGASATAPAGG